MRCQVVVNGEKVCLAGLEGLGSLMAVVTWVKRNPERFEGSTVGVSLEAW